MEKSEVLKGLKSRCLYFERNIQNSILFKPEFETSKDVNSILQKREMLHKADVIEIMELLSSLDEVEHYDGSGWWDYQIRLAHYLGLDGHETEFEGRKLRLTTDF